MPRAISLTDDLVDTSGSQWLRPLTGLTPPVPMPPEHAGVLAALIYGHATIRPTEAVRPDLFACATFDEYARAKAEYVTHYWPGRLDQ